MSSPEHHESDSSHPKQYAIGTPGEGWETPNVGDPASGSRARSQSPRKRACLTDSPSIDDGSFEEENRNPISVLPALPPASDPPADAAMEEALILLGFETRPMTLGEHSEESGDSVPGPRAKGQAFRQIHKSVVELNTPWARLFGKFTHTPTPSTSE